MLFFLNKKKIQRYYRCGAGDEKTFGSYDTPGFELIEEDKIIYKHNKRFRTFCLKRRNTRRMNQTSLPLLQSWRANVDVKI